MMIMMRWGSGHGKDNEQMHFFVRVIVQKCFANTCVDKCSLQIKDKAISLHGNPAITWSRRGVLNHNVRNQRKYHIPHALHALRWYHARSWRWLRPLP